MRGVSLVRICNIRGIRTDAPKFFLSLHRAVGVPYLNSHAVLFKLFLGTKQLLDGSISEIRLIEIVKLFSRHVSLARIPQINADRRNEVPDPHHFVVGFRNGYGRLRVNGLSDIRFRDRRISHAPALRKNAACPSAACRYIKGKHGKHREPHNAHYKRYSPCFFIHWAISTSLNYFAFSCRGQNRLFRCYDSARLLRRCPHRYQYRQDRVLRL